MSRARKAAAARPPRREPLPREIPVPGPARCQVCQAFVGAGRTFCVAHNPEGRPAAEVIEERALGPEAAAALRRDLDRTRDEGRGMRDEESQGQEPSLSALIPHPSSLIPVLEEEEVMADPVTEATRLAIEMARGEGASPSPSPSPSRKPGPRPVAPEAAAMRLALEAVAAERQEAARRQERRQGAGGPAQSATGRAAMALTAYFPEMPDLAAMTDSEGNSLVKPGWVPRWVRMKDIEGKPSERRLRMFRAWGAEDVLDETGKPLVDILGKAVQLPPERYAARVLRSSPTGAFDDNPMTEQLMDQMEGFNRQVGYRAGAVLPREAHGSRDIGE